MNLETKEKTAGSQSVVQEKKTRVLPQPFALTSEPRTQNSELRTQNPEN